MRIGLISDTHGMLRPEVFDHLAGVEHILHAGDVGPVDILVELESIAPVTAVWGNTDGWEIRSRCAELARLELGSVPVVVLHGHQLGSPTPENVAAAHPDARMVVFGHSHKGVVREVGDVLAVNPGSAGPRRFGTTPTLAVATIEAGGVSARLIQLEPPPAY